MVYEGRFAANAGGGLRKGDSVVLKRPKLNVEGAAELQEIFLWRELDAPIDDKRSEIEREVADIAICLVNFCNRTQIDLGAALRRKLLEAAKKYPVDRVRGRSDKYNEYPEWQDDNSSN